MVSSNWIIFSKCLNNSIWPMDKGLTGTTTPGQSWPGSNGNEKVLYIPRAPKLETYS